LVGSPRGGGAYCRLQTTPAPTAPKLCRNSSPLHHEQSAHTARYQDSCMYSAYAALHTTTASSPHHGLLSSTNESRPSSMNSLAIGHQARTINRINTELPTYLQRVPATTQSGPSGMIDPLIQNHTWITNRYTIHALALLQGIRCYSDASTLPDPSLPMPREARIGVFGCV
jgi:hypothetical protein